MKKVLGLDLGTASIGWAFVHEAENKKEQSKIIKTGVRVIHYGDNVVKSDASGNVSASNEPIKDFEKGMSLSMNAGRTKARGMRRNLQRYKQRRDNLIQVLKEHKIINADTRLHEGVKNSTFETLQLRAKAATAPIELEEFARVLLMLNKKRGYKSNRKAKSEEDAGAIDSMGVAKELYEREITPGQLVVELLQKGKKKTPDFYRSDLQEEFDKIWRFQKQFHPEVLTQEQYEKITGLTGKQTSVYFTKDLKIELSELSGNAATKKQAKYHLRSESLSEEKSLNELATVFSEINNEISSSSGYLGAISDRSKQLMFNDETVGQFLYAQVRKNPHTRLKKQVFYRQDYLNEFERIWETQAKAHPELTEELKKEVRDVIIFYQRRLKSQKHLIVDCEFEKGHKAIPKSSPLFQEFRILQNLNNLTLLNKDDDNEKFELREDQKELLKELLNFTDHLSDSQVKKLLKLDKDWKLNFKKVEGNRTFSTLLEAFLKVAEIEGHEIDGKLDLEKKLDALGTAFRELGIEMELLNFEIDYSGKYDENTLYNFWHLLYSAEEDKKLKPLLIRKYGFSEEAAKFLCGISFEPDYGRVSSRAIRKILPHLEEGKRYDEACAEAGYNHSSSITKEENQSRELADRLELLLPNSLRNPIVEKILNQVINQVNAILEHPEMGRPDEIRIEMSRELKKSAEERKEMTEGIGKATQRNEAIRKKLQKEFGFKKVSRNAIIRYKLWEECGHISIYTGKPIPRSELFGKKYDIEHVIPKARLFDDSYSNKILCERSWNDEKGDDTAFDFLKNKLSEKDFEDYLNRLEKLKDSKEGISKTKYRKLSWKSEDIPEDFIDRQLRESQYIAKKAAEILRQITRHVTPTIGEITNRLREDWELMHLIRELNWSKYDEQGLTETYKDKDGRTLYRIKDWSKRNDHRHHAMDALTVAFTKRSFVQYLNNLNARKEGGKKTADALFIQKKELYRDQKGKLRFKPPMPNFREEAKKHLLATLISFKSSSKVATWNKNKVKLKNNGEHIKRTLTPRGQLHKETVYGKIRQYVTREVPVNAKLTKELVLKVARQVEREALLNRLAEHGDDPKKAFAGKNSINKNPILLNGGGETLSPKVKLVEQEDQFTIRKEVSPENFKNEKSLEKIIDAGARRVMQKRLADFNGDAKAAFSNLGDNPIWLKEPIEKSKWKDPENPKPHELGIPLKRVSITGVKNAEVLHSKRGVDGKLILDEEGKEIPTSYVSTGNNHHAAIYEDSEGNLFDEVVSFFEATERMNAGLPVINQTGPDGASLKFTLKQNECFVFPADNFDPREVDLMAPMNYDLISPHLFRVQSISRKVYGNQIIRDYIFRHHLETVVVNSEQLKGIIYFHVKGLEGFDGAIKVRLDRLGQIVHVGE